MRRVLFVTLVLVLLLSTASTAFAVDPPKPAQLGEVWWFLGTGFFPGEEVGLYLYRPSTVAGWPLFTTTGNDFGAQNVGTGFMNIGESEVRRQSYPTWQFADVWGLYYAEFMLPRDEVWFPCSYPLKWGCNYETAPGVWAYHSPADQSNFEFGLVWPWLGNPMDTSHPLEALMISGTTIDFAFPMEVTGMYWKWSDIP